MLLTYWWSWFPRALWRLPLERVDIPLYLWRGELTTLRESHLVISGKRDGNWMLVSVLRSYILGAVQHLHTRTKGTLFADPPPPLPPSPAQSLLIVTLPTEACKGIIFMIRTHFSLREVSRSFSIRTSIRSKSEKYFIPTIKYTLTVCKIMNTSGHKGEVRSGKAVVSHRYWALDANRHWHFHRI